MGAQCLDLSAQCLHPRARRQPLCPASPQASLPELPAQARARFQGLGLSAYDARVLADDAGVAAYFSKALEAGAKAKPAANWIMGDVLAYCNARRVA